MLKIFITDIYFCNQNNISLSFDLLHIIYLKDKFKRSNDHNRKKRMNKKYIYNVHVYIDFMQKNKS